MAGTMLPTLWPDAAPEEIVPWANNLVETLQEMLVVGERGGLDKANVKRRGLALGNLDWVTVAYTSNASANTEDTVTHNLGRIPIGYLVIDRDKAGMVYSSNKGAWTTTTMRLKCDVGTTATTLLVF
jgi:hypothetical protein